MSGGIWLDNWRGLRNSALLGGAYIATLTQAYDTAGRNVHADGGRITSPVAPPYNGSGVLDNSVTVRFGQSDTAPSATDYNLGDPVMNNLTYVSASGGNLTYVGATVSRTYTVVVQNNSAAPVVFREYGLFVRGVRTSGSSTYNEAVMIYREVLDTPVTVNQYETAKITLTVSLTLGDPVPGGA